MSHKIEPSILRILNAKNETVGTGFLVSGALAVTCQHVAFQAGIDDKNIIRAQFSQEKAPIFAKVLDESWDNKDDIAFLQLESVPATVYPLRLGPASAAGEQGIGNSGRFIRQGTKLT